MLAGESGRVTTKGILMLLCVVFVIVFIWTDPKNNGAQVWGFLGDVGHFLTVALQKTVEFLGGLGS